MKQFKPCSPRILIGLFIAMFLIGSMLQGCAMFQAIPNPWTDMSHKERAAWANSIYSSHFDNHNIMTANETVLTEDQKKVLRVKKTVLVEAWPVLKTYSYYANSGQVPPEDVTAHVIRLINLLVEQGVIK